MDKTEIMIPPKKTQATIAVLNDIYAGGDTGRMDACHLTEQDMNTLFLIFFKCRTHQTFRQGGA